MKTQNTTQTLAKRYSSFEGLRTPRLLSRPDMFNLKRTWSQQRAQDADGINPTSLVRQRQQIVIEQDRASGYRVVLWSVFH